MKHNYRRYRDLLRFDVLEAVLKNSTETSKRYSFAVFSVIDCSNRVVLAGVAVYNEEKEDTYRLLFENFLKLQDGLFPEAILSDCSTPILRAVCKLSDQQDF